MSRLLRNAARMMLRYVRYEPLKRCSTVAVPVFTSLTPLTRSGQVENESSLAMLAGWNS